MGTNFFCRNRQRCAFRTKRNCGPHCANRWARAEPQLQFCKKEAVAYLRFVLRAAFGFAAAFERVGFLAVLVFFFMRA
jgi:hypothetical protein